MAVPERGPAHSGWSPQTRSPSGQLVGGCGPCLRFPSLASDSAPSCISGASPGEGGGTAIAQQSPGEPGAGPAPPCGTRGQPAPRWAALVTAQDGARVSLALDSGLGGPVASWVSPPGSRTLAGLGRGARLRLQHWVSLASLLRVHRSCCLRRNPTHALGRLWVARCLPLGTSGAPHALRRRRSQPEGRFSPLSFSRENLGTSCFQGGDSKHPDFKLGFTCRYGSAF